MTEELLDDTAVELADVPLVEATVECTLVDDTLGDVELPVDLIEDPVDCADDVTDETGLEEIVEKMVVDEVLGTVELPVDLVDDALVCVDDEIDEALDEAVE